MKPEEMNFFFLYSTYFKNLFIFIEVQLIYSVMLIWEVQQVDSVLYIYIYIFFLIFFSIMVYHILNIVLCAIQ